MKRITINAQQVGLVYKMGDLQRILTQGKHWQWWNESIVIYDKRQPFQAGLDLDMLLQNEELRVMLDLLELKDNEIALQYKSGNFHNVLQAGRHAFWKGTIDYRFDIFDLNDMEVPKMIERKVLHNRLVLPYLNVHVVESYEKGLLYIDGKFDKVLSSGVYYFWKNEWAVAIQKADLRKQMVEVSGQELLTKDKAAIRLNFYANYQIVDIEKAIVETKDFAKQLYLQLQLALRAYTGTQTLDMLLANKDAIATFVLEVVKDKVAEMGIEIQGAGIRDIILPGDVREIMNQVLIAEKKAQANVIMRREETASTRSLLNTAKLMEDNEMLYRLKEMELMEKIAGNVQAISLSGGGKVMDELKGLFGRN